MLQLFVPSMEATPIEPQIIFVAGAIGGGDGLVDGRGLIQVYLLAQRLGDRAIVVPIVLSGNARSGQQGSHPGRKWCPVGQIV